MSYPTVNSGYTTQDSGENATKHIVDTPTHSENDLIFIFAGIDQADGTRIMTKPSGFSIAYENFACYGDSIKGSLWYITASASEPSTYMWTSDLSER